MSEWPGRVLAWRRPAHWLGRTHFSLSGFRCLDSWGQVARVIGHPRSILCLGNGPSSEDPALEAQSFDCVLRVNWVWHARARFAAPAIVFTADRDLPPPPSSLPPPVIAFPTRDEAHAILRIYRAGNRMPPAYFVMAELPNALRAQTWPLRPTNGALMVAAAVALKPERLAIAGIDLYSHPAGKYPGETVEANEYDAIHSREADLAAIRLALGTFGGKLSLIGPLREAMARAAPQA